MDLGLKGKHVVITGASAGLGAAAAEALASEGAQLIINSRDESKLQAAASRIEKATGSRPLLAVGDVSTEAGRGAVVSVVKKHWSDSGVDVFVSNTGGPPPGLFLDIPSEQFGESANLLVESAVGLTRSFLPGMMERGWGRLIYITSVAVLQPVDALILSNSYRAAVTGFCKTISNTYASHGITANCVCPGYTATERLLSLAENLGKQSGKTPDEVMAGFAEQTASGRVGQPEELAALITFLAGEKAGYITGTSIAVDGGCYKGLL
ncbi:MAG: hypothetical protein DRP45_05985 [Candidatus Zixiibacteriota bacterium]|nr:MAG: hypothetical protein DRP45_05985 [candidate division Zixibacteria bacterium]